MCQNYDLVADHGPPSDRVPATDYGKNPPHILGAVSISDHDNVVAVGRIHRSGQHIVGKVRHREAQCKACFHTHKDDDHSMDHDICRDKDPDRAPLCMDQSPGYKMGHHKVFVQGIPDALV